jgi:hypothetical protein
MAPPVRHREPVPPLASCGAGGGAGGGGGHFAHLTDPAEFAARIRSQL